MRPYDIIAVMRQLSWKATSYLFKYRKILLLLLIVIFSYGTTEIIISHTKVAPDMLAACISKDANGNPLPDEDCITTIVKKLLDTYSTRDLINYTAASTTPDIILQSCHPIAHVIGRQTYLKVKSIERGFQLCTPSCRDGCIHGVLAEGILSELGESYEDDDISHADIGTIEKIGVSYCSRSIAVCHGIGHILLIALKNTLNSKMSLRVFTQKVGSK